MNQQPYASAADLLAAAQRGDSQEVVALLRAGMHPDSCNRFRETSLHIAAREGHITVVEELIKAGAKVDSRTRAIAESDGRRTPLHEAVENDRVAIAERLLSAGAEVDPVSQQGNTPLILASYAGSPDMVNLLLTRGADPDGPTNAKVCSTPLVGAATILTVSPLPNLSFSLTNPNDTRPRPSRETGLKILRALLRAGADPNRRSSCGNLPLHSCIIDIEGFDLLLKAGARIDATDREGNTCLLAMVRIAPIRLIQLSVIAGVDVNATSNMGESALMLASFRDKPHEVVDILVSAGANINAVDDSNLSVLDYFTRRLTDGYGYRLKKEFDPVIEQLKSLGAKTGAELHPGKSKRKPILS